MPTKQEPVPAGRLTRHFFLRHTKLKPDAQVMTITQLF
jgi:hypothetical protein